MGPHTVNSWFNASCFTTDALQQALTAGQPRFGNSGRNILDGPGAGNIDFSAYKNFSIGERAKLEFRFESFNIFNHANFGAPVPSFGSGNFGAIGGASEGRDIQFGLTLKF